MSGKGSNRRESRDDTGYRKCYKNIKGFEADKETSEKFEEKFMGKKASEDDEIISGKYFMG